MPNPIPASTIYPDIILQCNCLEKGLIPQWQAATPAQCHRPNHVTLNNAHQCQLHAYCVLAVFTAACEDWIGVQDSESDLAGW